MYEAPSLPASANVAYRRLDDKTTSASASNSLTCIVYCWCRESQCVGRRTYVKFKKLGFTSARVLVYMRCSTLANNKGWIAFSFGLRCGCTWKGVISENIGVFCGTRTKYHLLCVFKFKVIKNMFGKWKTTFLKCNKWEFERWDWVCKFDSNFR